MHVHLPSPSPLHPPPKKNCQIRDSLSIYRKIPPTRKKILCQKIHLPLIPLPPHSPRPHTPPPHPVQFFFLIWIICQLDSVLVYFLQTDKESKSKIIFFFFFFFFFFLGGGGGGLWRGWEGGVYIMYKCLKWHFYSSRNTNVPSYSEIHS